MNARNKIAAVLLVIGVGLLAYTLVTHSRPANIAALVILAPLSVERWLNVRRNGRKGTS